MNKAFEGLVEGAGFGINESIHGFPLLRKLCEDNWLVMGKYQSTLVELYCLVLLTWKIFSWGVELIW